MPRGKGPQQGTPGRGYPNRTDLAMKPDMGKNTAGTGGMTAPAPSGPPARTPDDTPMLTAPTQRPGEPITAGLPIGAGPGPEAMAGMDPRYAETQRLKTKWQPYLKHLVNDPETPESVKVMYRYLMGA